MRLYRIETEKKIIITGAASGIGKEIVKHCLSEGATVIAFDINEYSLNDLKFYPKKRQWSILPMKSSNLATALLHAYSEFNGLKQLITNC
nr:SDR family NAD(P)-dependent oxidoreductase [Neobacillus massiliamazoniensis]